MNISKIICTVCAIGTGIGLTAYADVGSGVGPGRPRPGSEPGPVNRIIPWVVQHRDLMGAKGSGGEDPSFPAPIREQLYIIGAGVSLDLDAQDRWEANLYWYNLRPVDKAAFYYYTYVENTHNGQIYTLIREDLYQLGAGVSSDLDARDSRAASLYWENIRPVDKAAFDYYTYVNARNDASFGGYGSSAGNSFGQN